MQKYDFHVSITYFQDNGHTSTGSAQACNSPIVILLCVKVFDMARFMSSFFEVELDWRSGKSREGSR